MTIPRSIGYRGLPALPADLLDRADVDNAVVEVLHQRRHVLVEEPLVGVHRVAGEHALARRRVRSHKGEELVLGGLQGDAASAHLLRQARLHEGGAGNRLSRRVQGEQEADYRVSIR